MASWMRRGGATEVTCPKSVEDSTVSIPCPFTWFSTLKELRGEAEVRGVVGLVRGDGEVVAPAQVEVHVIGQVLSVAAYAVRPRVEEAVP